jgi:hypothetical protein
MTEPEQPRGWLALGLLLAAIGVAVLLLALDSWRTNWH